MDNAYCLQIRLLPDPPAARRRGLMLALLASSLAGGGCVFDDIHEELIAINHSMDETHELLRDAGTTLKSVETQLEQVQRTNELLVELQSGLGTAEVAEAEGEGQEGRQSVIKTMERIDESLTKLDAHLAALRVTIANIDSTIPFLSLTPDEDEEGATDGAEPSDANAADPNE